MWSRTCEYWGEEGGRGGVFLNMGSTSVWCRTCEYWGGGRERGCVLEYGGLCQCGAGLVSIGGEGGREGVFLNMGSTSVWCRTCEYWGGGRERGCVLEHGGLCQCGAGLVSIGGEEGGREGVFLYMGVYVSVVQDL